MSSSPPIVLLVVPIPPMGALKHNMGRVIQLLTQLIIAKAQRQSVEVPDAAQREATKFRIFDFVRMNQSVFIGYNLAEDPQDIIEETHKIFKVMHLSKMYVIELSSYHLKDVVNIE